MRAWWRRVDWGEVVYFAVIACALVGMWTCMGAALGQSQRDARAGHPWVTIVQCDSIPRGTIALLCTNDK